MIGDNIRTLRELKGMTRREFGEKIRVSQDVINNVERGRVEPSGMMIKCICDTFCVNEKWLETGEGEMFSGDPLEAQIRAHIQSSLAMQSLLAAWDQMDDSGREVFEAYARNFVAEYQQRLADRATAEAEAIIESAISAPESGENLG